MGKKIFFNGRKSERWMSRKQKKSVKILKRMGPRHVRNASSTGRGEKEY